MKKAEHWRIDAFELWCWRRLLRVPWTARRSNQSILKEISPGCSLEGLMLEAETLATSCEELTHWKRPWCWERLGSGGEGDDRGWDGWVASPTQWACVWVNSGREFVMDRGAWHAVIRGVTKSQTWLSDWTELNMDLITNFHNTKKKSLGEKRQTTYDVQKRWKKQQSLRQQTKPWVEDQRISKFQEQIQD